MLLVLGIDPGSRYTGFGVVRKDGGDIRYVAAGRIKTVTDALGQGAGQLDTVSADAAAKLAAAGESLSQRAAQVDRQSGEAINALKAFGEALDKKMRAVENSANTAGTRVAGFGDGLDRVARDFENATSRTACASASTNWPRPRATPSTSWTPCSSWCANSRTT